MILGGQTIKYSYNDVPTLRQFAASDARIRGINGPFRSGKSSASVFEIARRGCEQKPGPDGVARSRWLVVRNTFSQLEDSTIRTTMMWLPQGQFGTYRQHDHTYTIKALTGVDLYEPDNPKLGGWPCEIEIWFRALDRPDHISKLLSVEVTGAWVNEAREVPWGIVEGIDGRIGQYPPKNQGGPTWTGMWLDTNPPDVDSKWYRFFEEQTHDPARVEHFQQPSGRSAQAENLSNLPSADYYTNLAYGKSEEWVKVYIDGQYGFVAEGRPVYPEYIDNMHCKAVEPIPGLPIIRSWDYGLCYSDDTEVLTDAGWKLFKDVDEKVDKAASRDPKTGQMEFAPIAFKIAKPFKGDMLEWSSTELNMLVTPEHRIPYTNRDTPGTVLWESAEWLAEHHGGHHYVDLTSRWTATFDSPGQRAYAEFMGLYLSEGSANARGMITIYQREQRPDMQRILDATGMAWRWSGIGKAAGWTTYDRTLGPALHAMGRAWEKRVPQALKDMAPEYIEAFIWAYTAGDGHVRTRDNGAVEHVIYTTSKAMADDMQELAQKVGWNSSMRWVPPQTSVLDGRSITGRGGWNITFKKRASRAELFARNFRRVAYDGMVYCLNVPHHTLYVRRKGKPHWNGNTPACIFSQVLPDGRWLTFDEMTTEDASIDEFSDDVLDHCARSFRGEVEFEDWGDPAGEQRAPTDKRTCFDIQHKKGIMVQGSIQEPFLRQESVRKVLRAHVGAFEPRFVLHPRCKVLRKGFQGGYARKRMQVSGSERYSEKPDKNRYSHPHDALQYAIVQYFASGLTETPETEDDFGDRPNYAVDATRSSVTGYIRRDHGPSSWRYGKARHQGRTP